MTRVDAEHSERACLLHGYRNAGHRYIGATPGMSLDEFAVIHLVNVIARKHQRVTTTLCKHEIEILVHGISGTRVPPFVQSLLRRPYVYKLAKRFGEKTPASRDVIDECLRFVLGEHRDAA